MQDILINLPTDKINPTEQEIHISNMLFSDKNNMNKNFTSELKNLLLLFIVFFIISTKEVENILSRFFPISQKSPYIGIAIKGLVFIILYWIISNISLSKN